MSTPILDTVDLLKQAKALGVKRVSTKTPKEKLRKAIAIKLSGDASVKYLCAGLASGLPQYTRVSVPAARALGELFYEFPYSFSLFTRGDGRFDTRGLGLGELVSVLVGGGVMEHSDTTDHRLTYVGEDILRNSRCS